MGLISFLGQTHRFFLLLSFLPSFPSSSLLPFFSFYFLLPFFPHFFSFMATSSTSLWRIPLFLILCLCLVTSADPAQPGSPANSQPSATEGNQVDVKEAAEDRGLQSQIRPTMSLLWMAPFLSGGGYCSEAISFMVSLKERLHVSIEPHGDSYSPTFVRGLSQETRDLLTGLVSRRVVLRDTIVVCHSEPGAWAVPKSLYPTSVCPPPGAAFRVGRTMFETDRFVEACQNLRSESDLPFLIRLSVFSLTSLCLPAPSCQDHGWPR